jgi:N-acyl-D-aspartate/D-glutamate deacylase
MRAGAFGWSTSRRTAHLTSDGRPVAARQATWDELFALGDVLGDVGVGVIQGLGGSVPNEDVEVVRGNMFKLAVGSGRLLLESGIRNSDVERLPFWASSTRDGGRIMGFVRPKRFELVTGFRVKLPFDTLESWQAVRSLPIAAQQEIFADPDRRAALVHDALTLPCGSMVGAEARPPHYERMYLMDATAVARPTVAEIAAHRGISPVDAIIDLSLESDFQQLFTQPDDDLTELNDESLLAMLRHPNTVMAGSDTGAHTTQSIDADFPTTLLGRWVRQREEFTWEEAVRMLTFEPALVWGFGGRGILQEGFAADLVVFDPETVGPATPYTDNGLPSGAPQLRERANGIHSVIVGGTEILHDNEPTGAHPGEVVRSAAFSKRGAS